MNKYSSLLGIGVILLTLNACHQKGVKSVVTPVVEKQELPSLELYPLNENARAGWAEIDLVGRKWYVDADSALVRDELASLSFEKNDQGDVILNIYPNAYGQNKINNAMKNKDGFILMVLNGKGISLSQLSTSGKLPFYVGDNKRTIEIAEQIVQKKISPKQ